jgi:hypothetical protein
LASAWVNHPLYPTVQGQAPPPAFPTNMYLAAPATPPSAQPFVQPAPQNQPINISHRGYDYSRHSASPNNAMNSGQARSLSPSDISYSIGSVPRHDHSFQQHPRPPHPHYAPSPPAPSYPPYDPSMQTPHASSLRVVPHNTPASLDTRSTHVARSSPRGPESYALSPGGMRSFGSSFSGSGAGSRSPQLTPPTPPNETRCRICGTTYPTTGPKVCNCPPNSPRGADPMAMIGRHRV